MPLTCFALPRGIDPNTPIQIQSDTASYEQTQRQAIHEGNVIMMQGPHELRADKIHFKKNLQGNYDSITALGNPATFTGKLADKPSPFIATAKTIYYFPEQQLVVLEGDAHLTHDRDKFQGPVLRYQLDKQIVIANAHKNERPVITIHPNIKKKEPQK